MSKYKILWIEDDANLIMGLMKPLLKEGCFIETALNIERAKQLLTKNKYNLIVLDIIIPSGKVLKTKEDYLNIERFNGLKFLEDLPKEFPPLSEMPPILVLSVVNDKDIIEKIKSFNKVEDVLLKGILKPSELTKRILKIFQDNETINRSAQ